MRLLCALAVAAALAGFGPRAEAAPSCDDPEELASFAAEELVSLAPVIALLPVPPRQALCALDGEGGAHCRIDGPAGGPTPPPPSLTWSRAPVLLARGDLPQPSAARVAFERQRAAREHPGYARGIDRPPRG